VKNAVRLVVGVYAAKPKWPFRWGPFPGRKLRHQVVPVEVARLQLHDLLSAPIAIDFENGRKIGIDAVREQAESAFMKNAGA
jgi:hypothetical protein